MKIRSSITGVAIASALLLVAASGVAHADPLPGTCVVDPQACGLPGSGGLGDIDPFAPVDGGAGGPVNKPHVFLTTVAEGLLSQTAWSVNHPAILNTAPNTLTLGGFPGSPRGDWAFQTIAIPASLDSPDFTTLSHNSSVKAALTFTVRGITTQPFDGVQRDSFVLSVGSNGTLQEQPVVLSNTDINNTGQVFSYTVDLSRFAGQTITLQFTAGMLGSPGTTVFDVQNLSVVAAQQDRVVQN